MIIILNVPDWVGVPEITPVVGLKDKPVGRTEAPIEKLGVEVLVVVVVYEKVVFTCPRSSEWAIYGWEVHEPPPWWRWPRDLP